MCWGCSKSEEVTPQFDLEGQWTFVSEVSNERKEFLLDFKEDSSFRETFKSYIYSQDRTPAEPRLISEYPGFVDVRENRIHFNVEE
ncbi:MAG: hypothetical protein ACI83B_000643 [Sediminicola sp.]